MMNEYGGGGGGGGVGRAGDKWKSSVSLQCSSVLMISLSLSFKRQMEKWRAGDKWKSSVSLQCSSVLMISLSLSFKRQMEKCLLL